MGTLPPLADLYLPPYRWQTVFASTKPLIANSEQNGDHCGIRATVWLQTSLLPTYSRGFLATQVKNSDFDLGEEIAVGNAAAMPGVATAPGG
jgi:hypothetical protein